MRGNAGESAMLARYRELLACVSGKGLCALGSAALALGTDTELPGPDSPLLSSRCFELGISPSHGSKIINNSSDFCVLLCSHLCSSQTEVLGFVPDLAPSAPPSARIQSSSSCLEKWCLFKCPSSAFSFRIYCGRWEKIPAQNLLKLQVLCSS